MQNITKENALAILDQIESNKVAVDKLRTFLEIIPNEHFFRFAKEHLREISFEDGVKIYKYIALVKEIKRRVKEVLEEDKIESVST